MIYYINLFYPENGSHTSIHTIHHIMYRYVGEYVMACYDFDHKGPCEYNIWEDE
jgi:hypothetical protein